MIFAVLRLYLAPCCFQLSRTKHHHWGWLRSQRGSGADINHPCFTPVPLWTQFGLPILSWCCHQSYSVSMGEWVCTAFEKDRGKAEMTAGSPCIKGLWAKAPIRHLRRLCCRCPDMKEVLYLTSISCIEDTLSPKEPEVGIMWHVGFRQYVNIAKQPRRVVAWQEARMPA